MQLAGVEQDSCRVDGWSCPPVVHFLGFSIYLPRFTSKRISSTQHTQRDACSHGGRNLPSLSRHSSSSDDPTPDEALGIPPRVNKNHADSHLNEDQAKLSKFVETTAVASGGASRWRGVPASSDVVQTMGSKRKQHPDSFVLRDSFIYIAVAIHYAELELSAHVHAPDPPLFLYESIMPTTDP